MRSRRGLTTAANFCGRWEKPGGHGSDVAPLATVPSSPRRITGCYSKLVKIHGQANYPHCRRRSPDPLVTARTPPGDGYDVLEAETGHAALEQLRDGVDLVLLDYRLPDIDGLAVFASSRSSIPTSW